MIRSLYLFVYTKILSVSSVTVGGSGADCPSSASDETHSASSSVVDDYEIGYVVQEYLRDQSDEFLRGSRRMGRNYGCLRVGEDSARRPPKERQRTG